jgi:manganese/iron transport system permease protein
VFEWFVDPFSVGFMQRALVAGLLVSVLCACAGVWVVQRGLAFLGDALGHGLLPGVAIAHLMGANLLVGAALSAATLVAGIGYVSRRRVVSTDTSIGLLFVGMLAIGVIVVSRSRSFAVDLTAFLFGDVLAASTAGNRWLAVATGAAVVTSVVLYRPFVALTFDERKAHTLGLRPGAAHTAMLILVAASVVVSFRIVGTLLVFGFLVAPPSTALLLVGRLPAAIVVATLSGWLAVVAGLLISWHFDTAAGATVAACAIAQFALALVGTDLARRLAPARA